MTFKVHCYDVDFPILLHYPIYECCGHQFSPVTPFMISKLPKETKANPGVLVTDKHFLVQLYLIKINSLDSKISITYHYTISRNI